MPAANDTVVRKPRVIDINAIINNANANANANNNGPSGGSSNKQSASHSSSEGNGTGGSSNIVLPTQTQTLHRYAYAQQQHNNPATAPLTADEKDRLAARRAEIAAALKAKEEADAAEALQRRASAVVAQCAPQEDDDEEEVLRRLEALTSKLEHVKEVFTQRAEGHEDGYRTWASAELYKKEEAQRVIDAEQRRQDAMAAAALAEERWVAYLRAVIESIVINIDAHYEEALVRREEERIAALDRRLQDEASERIRCREERAAAAARERLAFEEQLLGSYDPLIEAIRRERNERFDAFRAREAEAELDEEAALERKLARLSSLKR